jgi:hypothetical protein
VAGRGRREGGGTLIPDHEVTILSEFLLAVCSNIQSMIRYREIQMRRVVWQHDSDINRNWIMSVGLLEVVKWLSLL